MPFTTLAARWGFLHPGTELGLWRSHPVGGDSPARARRYPPSMAHGDVAFWYPGRVGRSLAVAAAVALAGCVFNSAGISPSSGERPGPRIEAAVSDRTLDGSDAPRDLPRGDVPGPDLPRTDSPRDVKTSDLRKLDLKLDLKKADQKKPDLPKPDQKKPDLPPPPSCASLFGSTAGYALCDETGTSCRFYVSASKNCTQICGSHACLKAEDNEPGTTCQPETNMSCGGQPCICSSTLGDGICTCAR